MINNIITSKYKKASKNTKKKKQINVYGKLILKNRGTKPIGSKWREQQLYNSERS